MSPDLLLPERGRILGLDFGDKSLGVAISDPLQLTASEVETIFRERPAHLRKTFARLEELILQYSPVKAVLGLPLNMDGTEGKRAGLTRQFGEHFTRRTGLEVVYQDERLTSEEAEEHLRALGIPRQEWKTRIDAIAAALILQDYIRNISHEA